MSSVELRIQTGADDGHISSLPSSTSFGGTVLTSGGGTGIDGTYTCIRFTGAHGIAKSAVIQSAKLYLTANQAYADIIPLAITAIKEDSAAQITDWDNYTSRTKTLSSINWNLGITISGGLYEVLDLKIIIQELTNQLGWTGTSPILLIIKRSAPTTAVRDWVSYEQSTSACPTLIVEYENSNGEYQQTVKSKARIFPTQIRQEETISIARPIGGKIEIMWDGMIWEDESGYLLTAKGDWQMSGKLGEGFASVADFELENTTRRFSPDNVDSPIYTYLEPRVNIRYSVVINGLPYLLFTGYIKAIEPSRKNAKINLRCFDNTDLVLNELSPRGAYVDTYTHDLIKTLGESIGLTGEDMDLENSKHIVRAAYFGDRNIWPVMGELAVAERGRVFFDVDGRLKFWSREHIQSQSRTMIISQNFHLLELEYSVEEQHLKNIVTVTARPRAGSGIQPVWTNGSSVTGSQYTDTLVYIPAGQTQYAFLDIQDAAGALPCTDWVQPIPYVDYIANDQDDNSGVDYTNSVKISEFIPYADSVFLAVQNLSAVGVFLYKFQVRANPLKTWKWIRVRHKDDTSISRYGSQQIDFENDFIDDEQMANDIAEVELARWKNAKNLFKAKILGVPYIKVGDIVGVELNRGQVEDYMIQSITWDVNSSGFIQQLQFVNKVRFPQTRRIEGRANIFNYVGKTISSRARIGSVFAHLEAKASITDLSRRQKTMTAKANILGQKTIRAKARIKATVTKTIQSLANITT